MHDTQLDRIEWKINHAHDMLHDLAEAVAALAETNIGNVHLAAAAKKLTKKTAAVWAALGSVSPFVSPEPTGDRVMANPAVDAAIAAMKSASSVDDSVLAFVAGIPAMIQAAVDAAVANGATAAELQPFTDLSTELTTKTAAIQAAITTNTPVTAAQAKAKK